MYLSQEDKYGLARAFAGLPQHPEVAVSPLVGLFIKNWEERIPSQDDIEQVRQVFGNDLIAQVFQVDPHGAAPVAADGGEVPPLPDTAQLDEAAVAQAERVGGWLNVFMKHAQHKANMTDPLFLESGGLWLIGLATARRVALKLDFGTIYNNHYAIWVAPTTYYRKTTGLRVVDEIARDTLGHFLLAGQSSPEMLLHKLSGQRTTNYEDLDAEEKRREDEGRQFAGQRGFISDEVSKLFAKDYMKGLPEVIMEMAEAPPRFEMEYKGMGKLVVRNAFLSLLFATTPAKVMEVFGNREWEDGLLPRFALLTPSKAEVIRTPSQRFGDKHLPPTALIDALRVLVNKLPQPKQQGALDENTVQHIPALGASIDDAAMDGFNGYADALHEMTRPNGPLDYRLAGVYGRLPTHGLRVALSLAVIDWAVASQGEGKVVVSGAHWNRAQLIVEKWRASAHRLLTQVTRSQDQLIEDQVLRVLQMHHPQPPTKYEISRRAKVGDRRSIYAAIEALYDAGLIMQVDNGSRSGYVLAKGV